MPRSLLLPILLAPALVACNVPPEPLSGPVAQRSQTAQSPGESWPGWGGPNGDFTVEARELAAAWPPEGPPLVWSRPLGKGYSAIAAADGVLFAMHREGNDELVAALRADDGSTIWEHRYEAVPRKPNQVQFGSGPNASPLVLDDRVITLGYTGVLSCLDRADGRLVWSHELIRDLDGEVLDFGYSASPILHDGRVIVLVGGKRQGAVALDPGDGSVVWSGPPSGVSYATPLVIDVDGQQQLLYFSADEIIGLDAADGTRLWSFPVVNQYRNNATDPRWGDDGLLWVATQLDGGTRALRLTRDGDATRVEQVWESNQLSIHFWNALRLGDTVYASIGGNATILAGVDVGSGEILWRRRGFEQVNFVHTGELTVLLDANGRLALARLSPDGIEVLAEARILDGPTWTAPTLVGTRLYLRDQQSIRALELGPAG